MKGDRVEVVVDTGHGTQTFEIFASRAGRRLEVATARGVVEVTEVTRGGNPVRTGRFMASRVVALVEHPVLEGDGGRVEIETRRRMTAAEGRGRRGGRGRGAEVAGAGGASDATAAAGGASGTPAVAGTTPATRRREADQLALLAEERAAAEQPDLMDDLRELEVAASDEANAG